MKTEFEIGFQDIKYLDNNFAFFAAPFSTDDVKVPTHIQTEPIDILNDSND